MDEPFGESLGAVAVDLGPAVEVEVEYRDVADTVDVIASLAVEVDALAPAVVAVAVGAADVVFAVSASMRDPIADCPEAGWDGGSVVDVYRFGC